jgi:hypothetical protein
VTVTAGTTSGGTTGNATTTPVDDKGGLAKGVTPGSGSSNSGPGSINSGRRPDDNASDTAKAVTAVVQQFEAARAKAIDDRKVLITQLEVAKTEAEKEAILAKLKAETQAERDQQATLGKQVRDELKKIRDSRTKPGI